MLIQNILFMAYLHTVLTVSLFSRSLLKSDDEPSDIKGLPALLKYLPEPSTISEEDLKTLRYRLGSMYNQELTSITEPPTLKSRDVGSLNGDELTIEEGMKTNPKMGDELKKMKLKKVYSHKRKGKRTELGKKTSHRIKNWLWDLSKCPVLYKWVDLGKRVYPRYIKRGQCSKKKTCSYPAGMKCQKKSWTEITTFIYLCLKDINAVSLSCKWRIMKLSVLSECKCACK